jgi:hypothetical protein
LVVLGVSRSGTSALARVLSLLGGALPATIMPAGHGNETGHWEPLKLMELNEAIFIQLGRDRDDPQPLPAGWFCSAAGAVCAEKMADVIAAEYGEAPLLVIKEPRLCRLAPLLFAALARLAIAPRVILPIRHPGEVALSLARRDGIAPDHSERTWLIDMLAAEEASRAHPRVWIAYEELLRDWPGVCRRVARLLHLAWPRSPEQAAADINDFLNPALRHFSSTDAAAEAGAAAARLWAAARLGLQQDETTLRTEFDALRRLV